MDVPEIASQTLPGIVGQGDERLPSIAAMRLQVTTDLAVTAGVALLPMQSPEELRRGVPLLGWGLLIGLEDAVDHRLERAELRRGGSLVRV